MEKAIVYYHQAIAIYKKLNNKIGLSRTYNNIGINYRKAGKFDSALIFQNRNLVIRRELLDSMDIAASYGNIGLIYKDMGELDLALEFENYAQKIAMKFGNTLVQVVAYITIGEILILKDEYQLAEYNLKQGLSYADSLDLKEWKAKVLGSLSILEEKRENY